jgi:hypothetical protein
MPCKLLNRAFLYYSPVGGTTRGPFSSAFLPDKLNSLCLEKRAFYRAISGADFFSLEKLMECVIDAILFS